MKKTWKVLILVTILVLVLGSYALARGMGRNYGRELTGKTEEIKGTIQSVDIIPPQAELLVNVNGKVVDVKLGPVGQYQAQDFSVNASITLQGEYVKDKVFIPYSLNVNGKVYQLRDVNGKPVWAGNGSETGKGQQNGDGSCSGDCDGCDNNQNQQGNCGGGCRQGGGMMGCGMHQNQNKPGGGCGR
ncbi:MAG: hypothetical protein NTX88_07400 [Candidatus Atribacteria bacterium]|nr:hypothetical protein [Candidatus Atribacteria bacterium]